MASITFDWMFNAEGALTIPREAVEQLGIHADDPLRIRIETAKEQDAASPPDQVQLQQRAARLFAEADLLPREPGKPLVDSQEAEWARGVEEKARKIGLKV